jgi:hypothetical protein
MHTQGHAIAQEVNGTSPQGPRVVHVTFLVNKAVLGQVSLQTLWFSSTPYSSIIWARTVDPFEVTVPKDPAPR